MQKRKVCVIGGGTGTVAVLNGLKHEKNLDLSVIVSMTDDGGSNKILRDEFGLLPLSDLRKSIVALSRTGNGIFRELFVYRFAKGDGLSGHTLGNLIMTALTELTGSEQGAIDAASKIFDVAGKIIPVTYGHAKLAAKYGDGSNVHGEHLIDEPELASQHRILELFLVPKVKANPAALQAIAEADYLVIGPGDLYTSLLANIIIDKVPEAIKNSKAKIILVTNLMSKRGQTQWMTMQDFVNEMERYSTRRPDIVLINNLKPSEAILKKYASEGDFPFNDDVDDSKYEKVVRTPLMALDEIKREKGDTLARSLVRHDEEKLSKTLLELFKKF